MSGIDEQEFFLKERLVVERKSKRFSIEKEWERQMAASIVRYCSMLSILYNRR